ncbi:MAG: hypothetical protein C4555_04370 [Dehalococcoidia bacterium]|nr:MAG: hypothetical protein C4555_04370 [Dehalococcoidia bacterium]
MDDAAKNKLMDALRSLFAALGMILAAFGVGSEELWMSIGGAVVTVISTVWPLFGVIRTWLAKT